MIRPILAAFVALLMTAAAWGQLNPGPGGGGSACTSDCTFTGTTNTGTLIPNSAGDTPGDLYGVGAGGKITDLYAPSNAPITASNGSVSRTLGSWAGDVINLKNCGAVGNALSGVDGIMSSGSPNISSSSAVFTNTDIGKSITVNGSGSSGAVQTGTILAIIDANDVTASFSAVVTVANATYTYGTDDSAAIAVCVGKINAQLSKGIPTILYAPMGAYLVKSNSIPTFIRGGGVIGDGPHRSLFILDAAYAGDLFSWSESWARQNTSYAANTLALLPDQTGVEIANIGVIGNQAATSQQNAFQFYDRNDFVNMHNIEVWYVHGYALAVGVNLKQTTQAYMRESHFSNFYVWASGTAALPSIQISSYAAGGGDSTNEVSFDDIHVVGSPGKSLVINNGNTGAGVRMLRFFGLRLEGAVAGDLLTIGDGTLSGNVNSIEIHGFDGEGVASGYNTVVFTAPSSFSAPYAITLEGVIPSGVGNGINVVSGRLLRLRLPIIATTGTNIIVGATPLTGGPIEIDGAGAERSFTYSVDGSASTIVVQYPAHISYQNTVNGVDSIAVGGQLALLNGTYSASLAGYGNWTSGYAPVVAGVRAFNRGRFTTFCLSGNYFSQVGDQQWCFAPLAGSGSGSTIRLTAGGAPAGTGVVYDLQYDGLAYNLSCYAIVRNTATGDAASYHSQNMVLRRKTGASSVALNGATSAITFTQDYAENTLAGVLTVTAAPDTTNSGINLSVAQTGTLSLHAVAQCNSIEVQ